jgi:hypothetical protein
MDHRIWSLTTALVLSLTLGLPQATPGQDSTLHNLTMKRTPDAERRASFSISEAAIARIESVDFSQLVDDSTFIATLRAVLTDQHLSSVEKTDAFYLMLRTIGWDFTGTLRTFPRRSYPETFNRMVMTYLSYHDALADLQFDPTELLALASRECDEHVVRCSHALLLGVIANRKASKPTLGLLLEVDAIRRAEVPPILLHHLSLATALSGDVTLAARLGELLSEMEGEEEQEDVLSAVGMFDAPQTASIVTTFLKQALKTEGTAADLAVDTALFVLRDRLEGPAFEQTYADLLELPPSPKWRAQLIELQQEGFAPFTGRDDCCGFTKYWDGFANTVYADGTVLAYGPRFRDFRPSKPPYHSFSTLFASGVGGRSPTE